MTLTEYAILGIAAHRLWVLYLTQPAFEVPRRLAGRIHPKLGDCGVCVSVWTAAAVLGLWYVPGGAYVLYALAVSDGIAIVDIVMGACERIGRPQFMYGNGAPVDPVGHQHG